MSQTLRCPHCGSPVRSSAAPGPGGHADAGRPGPAADAGDHVATEERGLDSLYREVRRIREIAESREAADGRRCIAELTRELQELRATVARLRGSAPAGMPADPAADPAR